MLHKLKNIARAARITMARALRRPHPGALPKAGEGEEGTAFRADGTFTQILRARRTVAVVAGLAAAGWLLYAHPPIATAQPGELGVRTNQLTGTVTQWRDGSILVLPGLHHAQVFSLRDQTYKPQQMTQSSGQAPLQSVEGLSVGVDLVVRYALDPQRVATAARSLPSDPAEVVEPAVLGVVYKVFARYTVREIFSTKRAEIQQTLEAELKPKLAADGLVLRSVLVGKVDLPADYKRGMEGLLAEELETQKMRYTLELKDKRVRQVELEASAEKVQREVRAEAAAREQVIAAKGQEEAMKHVLPFKQRQIEQRQLEAEAEKQSRMKVAEGNAHARRIEATGEADARRKLAEAEVFRMERVGQANAEQMAREGALITRHPLLIQKTLADKLSDKIQVIIAPPGSGGGFLAANLLGNGAQREGMQQAATRETQAEE
ncbi:prohibitin family protein [Caenimonas sedimenti]|uniref:Prohibitin family protein n=1 Tax=Caenimonas sedimenti TaxID=2596921 RepID=A0A562ZMM3_9BURK|nr:SPFH domain-containing protein [Caenimonas sedimenti]TWO69842.1 prohibitin family protein [Caenimonas sedimenti]